MRLGTRGRGCTCCARTVRAACRLGGCPTSSRPRIANHDRSILKQLSTRPLLFLNRGLTALGKCKQPTTLPNRRDLFPFGNTLTVGAFLVLLGVLAAVPVQAQTPPGICDRTQQVQDEILHRTGVSDCADVTTAHLTAVTELTLESVGLTSLRADDFADLSELKELRLTGNNLLFALPSGVFSGLAKLETLDLYNNQFYRGLPAGVFSGLAKLETLNLGANRIPALRAEVFSGLSALETLNLERNRLPALPAGVFSGLTKLKTLSLSGNLLTAFPAGVFAGLAELETLDLGGNLLAAFPAGVFAGLAELETLILRWNQIGSLPDGAFSDLPNLEKLDLFQNLITALPPRVFSGLTKLKVLMAGSNQLVALPDGVFAGLTMLDILDVAENPVHPLLLSVTVETVGSDRVRAKVPAGAPFALSLPVSVTNGGLAGGASTLEITAGAVVGEAVAVTRTEGTTEAVTVDLGTPLPSLPMSPQPPHRHRGYAFVRAPSGLPVEIPPDAAEDPGEEGEFRLTDGVWPDEGRAEVFHAGRWGTVCSDRISKPTVTTWEYDTAGNLVLNNDGAPNEMEVGNMAAARICAAMGDYDTGKYVSGYGQSGEEHQPYDYWPANSSYPLDGPQPIWLDDLVCMAGGPGTSVDRLSALDTDSPEVTCSYAGWGLHNCTHAEDAGVRCSNAGPLSAEFQELPPSHDGQTAFTFRILFDEAVATSAANMRDHALMVTGGMVTAAARVPVVDRVEDGRADADLWSITVTPSGTGAIGITLPPGPECTEAGAICTAGGRRLSSGRAVEVAAEETTAPATTAEPLTAEFRGLPTAHDGQTAFTFRIAFSEAVATSAADMRDHALTVTGGTVTAASQVDGRADLWSITVTPSGAGAIGIVLPPGRDCAEAGAVCTTAGRRLSTGRAVEVVATAPATTAEPLTAEFRGLPTRHDGRTAFTFRIAFSEEIGISYRTLRDDAFTVSGGEVTGARRVDGHHDLWEITVAPDSDGDVTITLPGDRACGTAGAVCTRGDDPSPLTNSPSATVAGPSANRAAAGAPTIGGTPRVGEELTASTSGISDADGLDDASFAYRWIRAGADIQGATGSTYTPVAADEGKRLKVRVSFTDDAGNEESLTSAATAAVAALPEPLTASFEGMPAEHDGQGSFSFRVAFSEGIRISYKTVRDASFTVTAGEVTQARRVDGRRDLWKITIEPDSDEAVTVRLPETTDCDTSGAICTGDGRPLSHALSATVAGPVGISVADARVEEGEGTVLAFLVTLSRTPGAALTVDYATADGSAHAGDDYRAASGTLKFRAGESSQRIEVVVLDDDHDEGEETLTVRLSNASSGRLTDGEATGTIENRDPLPRALLARFGRTAAVHVVEQVEERLEARRAPGFEGRFAGRELRGGMEREVAENFLRQLGAAAGVDATGAGAAEPLDGERRRRLDGVFSGEGLLRLGLGGGDVLTGSGFALNRATGHGGMLSFWSRGAQSRFAGRDGALSLGGDVRTTMFGADYAKGPLTAGLSLSHSGGVGEYAGFDAGEVVSSVTGLYPWLGYRVTERLSVWGVAGYGSGALALTPAGGSALESELGMAMAALGARGELFGAGGAAGYGLAFKADALWVHTAIEGVDGPAGRLKATAAAVTRLRTALEGSRDFRFGSGVSLKPSVELGVRRDGGDAETGAGMDVGGGLVVSAPSVGVSAEVRVRMLLAHEAEEFTDRGVSVSLSYNPTPSTPFGLRARLAPSWGGQATSGAEALWGRETLAGMASGSVAAGNRLDADIGYGLPVGRRLVGTPRLGVMTSGMGRDYRLGYGLGVLEGGPLNFELGIDAQRRESPLAGGVNHGVAARATLRW